MLLTSVCDVRYKGFNCCCRDIGIKEAYCYALWSYYNNSAMKEVFRLEYWQNQTCMFAVLMNCCADEAGMVSFQNLATAKNR